MTQPTVNQQFGQTYAPKKKAVNKTVTPIPNTAANTTQQAVDDKWRSPDYIPTGSNQNFSARVIGDAPTGKANDVKTIAERDQQKALEAQKPLVPEQKPTEDKSNNYTGAQDTASYQYDPRDESLVQNQITGLLDPNSAMMRKAVAQAQGYNASRGLQSSSLGSEVALSSMIDKALPIAQQDANTYATADQTGWQNQFNSNQTNLSRSHDAMMLDKQTSLQEQRDNLMNQFDMSKMDKTYLQDLEKTKLTWEHDDAVFTRNLNGQTALEYRNASADAYNKYLEQIAAVYSNPEMTSAQQLAGVRKLEDMFKAQREQMQIIFGVSSSDEGFIDFNNTVDTGTPAPPNDGTPTIPEEDRLFIPDPEDPTRPWVWEEREEYEDYMNKHKP